MWASPDALQGTFTFTTHADGRYQFCFREKIRQITNGTCSNQCHVMRGGDWLVLLVASVESVVSDKWVPLVAWVVSEAQLAE